MDKNKIVEALRTIKDPVSGKSIIDARLVEALVVDGNNVSFSLISSAKDSTANLNFACIEAINGLYPEAEVHVHVKTDEHAEKRKVLPQVKNIIAVASGKGGVGKSTVATNLALGLKALGAKVGLLDADIYGPSLPTMLNLQGQRPNVKMIDGRPKMLPIEKFGLETMSIGFIIEPEQAVVLRGPRLGAVINQFLNECIWGTLDYLIIDLPPGTGDVHLSIVQALPLTGVVMVTTPQKVALADAIKGMNMFRLENVNVPILGVVENMSWFTPAELPTSKYFIFGKGGGKELAKLGETMLLGQVPLVQDIREAGDEGVPAVLGDQEDLRRAFMEIAQHTARQVAYRNADRKSVV